MTEVVPEILVRKSVVVNAPIAHVFDVFTAGHDAWWPRSHHIGDADRFTAVLEPRAGGRWFERGDDGRECDWGRVLVYDRPHRLVLEWNLDAEWKHDPALKTEVDVEFADEAPERTRVVLTHRKLERYGEKADAMRGVFESDNAWSGILAAMRQQAEARRR